MFMTKIREIVMFTETFWIFTTKYVTKIQVVYPQFNQSIYWRFHLLLDMIQ